MSTGLNPSGLGRAETFGKTKHEAIDTESLVSKWDYLAADGADLDDILTNKATAGDVVALANKEYDVSDVIFPNGVSVIGPGWYYDIADRTTFIDSVGNVNGIKGCVLYSSSDADSAFIEDSNDPGIYNAWLQGVGFRGYTHAIDWSTTEGHIEIPTIWNIGAYECDNVFKATNVLRGNWQHWYSIRTPQMWDLDITASNGVHCGNLWITDVYQAPNGRTLAHDGDFTFRGGSDLWNFVNMARVQSIGDSGGTAVYYFEGENTRFSGIGLNPEAGAGVSPATPAIHIASGGKLAKSWLQFNYGLEEINGSGELSDNSIIAKNEEPAIDSNLTVTRNFFDVWRPDSLGINATNLVMAGSDVQSPRPRVLMQGDTYPIGSTPYYIFDDFGDSDIDNRADQFYGTYHGNDTDGPIQSRFRPSYGGTIKNASMSGGTLTLGTSPNGRIATSSEMTRGRWYWEFNFASTPSTGFPDWTLVGNSGGDRIYMLIDAGNGFIILKKYDGGTISDLVAYDTGDWDTSVNTAAAERDGDTWEFFVNGSSRGTATDSFDPSADETALINRADEDMDIHQVRMESL